MVQLLVNYAKNIITSENKFQFQYGAIISQKDERKTFAVNTFQFQYGAIIRKSQGVDIDKIAKFQFQYGAIIRPLSRSA